MGSSVVFNQVIILFLIMVIGFIAKKRNILNSEVNKKLSEFLLNVTTPFLIITSFSFKFSKGMLYNAGIVLAFSVGVQLFSILLGKLLYFRYPDNIKKVLKFITVYSNCGFMGFPILESLFGKEGVFYGSIYVAAFNIFLWTHGVAVFTGSRDLKTLKKALINPGIIGVAMGMIIFLFSVTLPYPVFKTLEMVGSMTAPLSMIIVGAFLADVDFKNLFSGFAVYHGTAVRLIALPILTLITLRLIGMTGTLLGICVILTAMPAAANTAIFAELYGGDAKFASRSIAITTVLSIITIPLIILLT